MTTVQYETLSPRRRKVTRPTPAPQAIIPLEPLDILDGPIVSFAQQVYISENTESREPELFLDRKADGFRLYSGDTLNLLRRAPDDSVDVIFADPPYFLSNNGVTCKSGRRVSVNKGLWDASNGHYKDYEFNKAWLRECQRILKPTGSLWVSGTLHNIYAIGLAMQELGLKILNDIAWYKVNPPPNLSCRYFAHSTETILWARKSVEARHKFNYRLMKELNGGKQMKNLWHIKPPKKWEKRYGKHPTQKPEELLDRIILASTDPGDLVVDPFSGSGTTGISAVRHHRMFIGIDLDKTYLEIAKLRLLDELARLRKD